MVRVAINGFGRIGRLILRAGINDKSLDFVAINNPGDISGLAHLFKYDTIHKKFNGNVFIKNNSLFVDDKEIKIVSETDPEKLPWGKIGVDVVVESTGMFRTYDAASKHLKAGAKKVLISAPGKGDGIKTIVKGINEHTYNNEPIVSNASCTTNCFAPMAKVINDNFGILDGVMITVHAYTASQKIVDSSSNDLREARSAGLNIIPTSTGAAKAVIDIMPELNGRLYSSAVRVPVTDGSVCYFIVETKNKTNVDEVNNLFKNVSQFHLKGIIEYCEDEIVSSDVIGNPHSCIFDSKLTKYLDNRMLEVVGWYDNEWGYSNRMIDVIKIISK